MPKDYYQILGIPRIATDEQIKKVYRKLAMQYHPDRNPGKEKWANEKFKEINEAYAVLGDPKKRKQYDEFGTVGDIGDIFRSSSTRSTFEDLMGDFDGAGLKFDFLDDIFGEFLGGKGFSFRVFSTGTGSPKGMRFETPTGINLDEILRQAQRSQRHDARYDMTITKDQAAQGLEKDLVRKGKKLRVRIPPGIKSGTTVRLRNARQVTDGQQGDIIIQVKVK